MISLARVSASGSLGRGRRVALTDVTLRAELGVLAIVGRPADGTTLLFDVIEGRTSPRSGDVSVLGKRPLSARRSIARVTLEAPLPETMRVDDVCALAADLRGEPARAAAARLDPFGLGALAPRRVSALTLGERRAVSLAIALTSSATLLLVEEPLAMLDAVAPRFVESALRAFAAQATVLVATPSSRDALALGDRFAILANGALTALAPEAALASAGAAVMTLTVPSADAPRILELLGVADGITSTTSFGSPAKGVLVRVTGPDLPTLAAAVTRAVAGAGVSPIAIETPPLPFDVLRQAIACGAPR